MEQGKPEAALLTLLVLIPVMRPRCEAPVDDADLLLTTAHHLP